MDGLEVRMLGGFSVAVDGVEVTRWRAGKARCMMQYLLMRRNTVVSRVVLNDVLWPGEVKASGYSSLKVAAHALRKVLTDNTSPGGEPPAQVDFQDVGYVLRASRAWLDVEELQQHAKAGFDAEARDDLELATKEYKAAAELYSGDFLPGEEAAWVMEQQVWFRAIALRVYHRLAFLALNRGQEFEALEWSSQAVELDPCNEKSYRMLMNLHARRGELGMALSWYSLCESRLRDDLGVPVSDGTRRILAEIVHHDQAGSVLPAPAGVNGSSRRRDRVANRPDPRRVRSAG